MRTSVVAALTEASRDGLIPATSVPVVADRVLEALAISAPDSVSYLTVLPAATPMLTLDVRQVVADAAAAALSDAEERSDTVVTTAEFPAGDGVAWERHCAWTLRRAFGVAVFVGTRAGVWKVGGTTEAIRAFRTTVLTTVLNGGREAANALPESDRAQFWATLGSLIAQSSRVQELIAANADNCRAGREALIAHYGAPQRVDVAATATQSSPVYAAAADVLGGLAVAQ